MLSKLQRAAGMAATVFLAMACSDAPTASDPRGAIRVSVDASGTDLDLDGFEIVLDGNSEYPLSSATSLVLRDIAAGAHTVTVDSVAANCTVTGAQPQTVTVQRGQTVDVVFHVLCAATGVAVTAHATGSDIQDQYTVTVYETPVTVSSASPVTYTVDADSSILVSRLHAGSYVVTLNLAGDNCTVANGNPDTVSVAAAKATPVLFDIRCSPVVRPEKIAYAIDTLVVPASQTTWIELANVTGFGISAVARGHSPAWSSDGTRVVFSNAECDQHSYYYYYDYYECDGGLVEVDPETRNVTELPSETGATSPSWAPSGDAIAYSTCCDASGLPQHLYVLDLKTKLSTQLPTPGLSPDHPTWSPDGKRIAFDCFPNPTNSSEQDLCAMNRDGSGFVVLAQDSTPSAEPAWSPDGKRIAFTRNGAIAILELDGGAITKLRGGSHPTWSPDGGQLAFAEYDGLYIMDRDGSIRRHVTSQVSHDPAWRP